MTFFSNIYECKFVEHKGLLCDKIKTVCKYYGNSRVNIFVCYCILSAYHHTGITTGMNVLRYLFVTVKYIYFGPSEFIITTHLHIL